MNSNTLSPECYDGTCSACDWDDCACECHLRQELEGEAHYLDELSGAEEGEHLS